MKDTKLMIAVIGCFAIAVLFILVIVWEIKKSIDYGQKVRRLSANVTKTVEDDNRDFSIYESIVGVDEREMILIPEGVFTRGADRGGFDEKPEQEIYLDAFYVDKYEVTVKAYNIFRRNAAYVKPSIPFLQGDEKILETPTFPVVGVSWYDSVNYCKWAEKRLLTEAEWEKAARGTDQRIFPWGNEFPDNKRVTFRRKFSELGFKVMEPVNSMSRGVSPYGIHHMAGNVWECLADWFDGGTYRDREQKDPKGPETGISKVLRGGNWYYKAYYMRTAYRFNERPDQFNIWQGFRCARRH